MTSGTQGLNKRKSVSTDGDTFLTPRWAVLHLLYSWAPAGSVICDPCACGYAGWSIGGEVQAAYPDVSLELYDITPQSDVVTKADFRDLVLPTRHRTIITNPPYDLLSNGEFMRWARQYADEIVVLTRFGYLCAEDGARAKGLTAYYQPARRMAFELLPKDKDREGSIKDPNTLTGWRLPSTGVDHGWAVFRRGHEGPADLWIESARDVQNFQEEW